MPPTPGPRCPLCGDRLQPVIVNYDSAPWLCAGDARGWWDAELTAEARRTFDPRRRDFSAATARILAAVDQEKRDRGNRRK